MVRPTGLLDPEVEIRPAKNQVDDLLSEINKRGQQRTRFSHDAYQTHGRRFN